MINNSYSQVEGDSHPSNGSDSDSDSDDDKYFYVGLYMSIAAGFYVGFSAFFGTLAFKDSWRHRFFKFVEHIVDWVYVRVAIQVAKFHRNRNNPQTVPN